MKVNTGIILVLAYPETIVKVAKEWYSFLLRYVGVGKKDYLKAGHAALVLINKSSGVLEYHDFGRYITKEPHGRVRGLRYDAELNFPIRANIVNNQIENLDEILSFLSLNPELTHGDGKLVASVCDEVNYNKAKAFISNLQRHGSIRYAAFLKNATNCARFVASVLCESVTNKNIQKKITSSLWFTPSTVGNVVLASSNSFVYLVKSGVVSCFKSTVFKENKKYFLDRLSLHRVDLRGTIEPMEIKGLHASAQWLSGIAAGAWYEITFVSGLDINEYRFRRVSPNGRVDIDAVFASSGVFDINKNFKIMHNSNCSYCTINQGGVIMCLLFKRAYVNSVQKEHST